MIIGAVIGCFIAIIIACLLIADLRRQVEIRRSFGLNAKMVIHYESIIFIILILTFIGGLIGYAVDRWIA